MRLYVRTSPVTVVACNVNTIFVITNFVNTVPVLYIVPGNVL
jgi:hypothetical protein